MLLWYTCVRNFVPGYLVSKFMKCSKIYSRQTQSSFDPTICLCCLSSGQHSLACHGAQIFGTPLAVTKLFNTNWATRHLLQKCSKIYSRQTQSSIDPTICLCCLSTGQHSLACHGAQNFGTPLAETKLFNTNCATRPWLHKRCFLFLFIVNYIKSVNIAHVHVH